MINIKVSGHANAAFEKVYIFSKDFLKRESINS